jgi:hypothetical protein
LLCLSDLQNFKFKDCVVSEIQKREVVSEGKKS